MIADTYNFRKSRHLLIDPFRQCNQAIRYCLDIFLQESIRSTCTELTRSQIILCYDLICFTGEIRNHNDILSHRKCAGRIIDHLADSLVDECHGKLFPEDFFPSGSLIISLIRITDRQVGRTYNDLLIVECNVLKDHLKLTRPFELIYRINHRTLPPSIISATFRSCGYVILILLTSPSIM